MVTALNEASDFERGVQAGTDDFLTKPVNKIELLCRIRSLLRVRHLRTSSSDLGVPRRVRGGQSGHPLNADETRTDPPPSPFLRRPRCRAERRSLRPSEKPTMSDAGTDRVRLVRLIEAMDKPLLAWPSSRWSSTCSTCGG